MDVLGLSLFNGILQTSFQHSQNQPVSRKFPHQNHPIIWARFHFILPSNGSKRIFHHRIHNFHRFHFWFSGIKKLPSIHGYVTKRETIFWKSLSGLFISINWYNLSHNREDEFSVGTTRIIYTDTFDKCALLIMAMMLLKIFKKDPLWPIKGCLNVAEKPILADLSIWHQRH